MRSWQSACRQLQWVRRIVRRMGRSRVAAALSGWTEAIAAARLAQARVGRAIGWWWSRRVAAAWSGWHSRIREQIRLRRLAQRCVTVLRERLLSRSLRRWCHFWLRRAAARRTVVPMTRFGEAKALRCWVQWWRERQMRRRNAEVALRRMLRYRQAVPFCTWRARAAAKRAAARLLGRALGRMRHVAVAAAVSRWRSTATDARRRRALLERATARMRH